MQRTIVIGDIHGEIDHLDRLLGRLPPLDAADSVVFLGDYVDRGPASRQVIERVRSFQSECPGRCITLRGNHEDAWLDSLDSPNPGFLLPAGNGCEQVLRSFRDVADLSEAAIGALLLSPEEWFPPDVRAWFGGLPLWHEDQHAIYVHAGLDGEGDVWAHPSTGRDKPLLWMRERDFYANYRGKRVVFGHTPTSSLPDDLRGGRDEVWVHHDLIGLDTGCGRGGWLSAVVLPSVDILDSR